MSIVADKKHLENILLEYRRRLDAIPDNQFNAKPPQGGWSYAEVYSHILQSNLASLIAVEKCINGTSQIDDKRLGWLAWLIFLTGKFPPFKFKVPKELESIMANISKEEARNLLIKLKNRVDQLAPAISKSSTFSKVKHPRLGLLNAKQWLKFITVHTRHHLKQLDRLNKEFNPA